jgi:hypothetical protein
MIYIQPIGGLVAHVRYQPPADPDGWIAWDGKAFAGDAWDGSKVVPAQAPDLLTAARESASMSRQSFCLALYRAQILNEPDAIAAAKGEWPAALDDLLNDLTAAEAAEARIVWATSSEIHRLHPLLASIAAHMSIDDAGLDVIFGLNGQGGGA